MPKKTWIVILAVAVAVIAALWFTRRPAQESPKGSPLYVGAILPLTGPAATLGKWGAAGLEMAVEDVNRAGGIEGRRIILVEEDSAGDPSKGVSALNKLLAVNHPEVVFSIVSTVDLALIPIAEREPVVLFSHASHPEITKGRKHVLRHSNTVTQEADVIVRSISDNDVKHGASILYLRDDYGVAFAKELQLRMEKRFPRVQLTGISYEREEATFMGQVTQATQGNPSLVIIAGVGKSTGLPIRRLRELAYKGKIIATLAFLATDGPTVAGDAAEGVWCIDFVPPAGVDATDLRNRYKERTGEDSLPMGVVIFYNSAQLWVRARAAVKQPNPDLIVSYVKNLGTFPGKGETLNIEPNADILPELRLIQYMRPR